MAKLELSIDLTDVLENIRLIVREEILKAREKEMDEQLLSPKAVCELFDPKISIQTLHRWRKQGSFPQPFYVGSRTFWRRSEIIEVTKKFKRYGR